MGKDSNYMWDDLLGEDPKKIIKESKKKPKSVPVSFSLREDLFDNLGKFCYWKRVTRSEVVEKLLEKFLDKNAKDLKPIPKNELEI